MIASASNRRTESLALRPSGRRPWSWRPPIYTAGVFVLYRKTARNQLPERAAISAAIAATSRTARKRR
jgi:hypothetical protein